MKTKKLTFSLLTTIVAICLLSILSILLFGDIKVQVASAADLNAVDYDKYTDSDTLLGDTKTIRDYASTLHHSTVAWDGSHYSVTEDDPIVKIIPKSLFATKGEYLHIGKEYGFFVKTTADTFKTVPATSHKSDPYNNSVEVLVFDITNRL